MKPQITIDSNNVTIVTDQFSLNLVFSNPIIHAPTTENTIDELNNKLFTSKLTAKPLINKPTASRVSKKPRKCKKCGKNFTPEGNRQAYCSVECGMKPKSGLEKLKAKKNLSPEEAAELEATLREIEEKKKQPYQFDKRP